MALTGADPVGLRSWVNDLTYKEGHAATIGSIHSSAIMAAVVLFQQGIPYMDVLAAALVVAALYLLGLIPKAEATGVPGVAHILDRLPASLKGQIRDEPHYYGGFGLGTLVVEVIAYLAFTFGLFPPF